MLLSFIHLLYLNHSLFIHSTVMPVEQPLGPTHSGRGFPIGRWTGPGHCLPEVKKQVEQNVWHALTQVWRVQRTMEGGADQIDGGLVSAVLQCRIYPWKMRRCEIGPALGIRRTVFGFLSRYLIDLWSWAIHFNSLNFLIYKVEITIAAYSSHRLGVLGSDGLVKIKIFKKYIKIHI